jgi:hypothetical protein
MALKRKPPKDNVRRVAAIGSNLRYTVTGKNHQIVQCESFLERKLTLRFDRDPSIRTYVSQPEQFTYLDAEGKTHTYTPDFIVWRETGEIEIHEVTLIERQEKLRIQEREKAARQICQQRGWRYVVHTEATLPQATEAANLLALSRYRPTAYANPEVTHLVEARLADPSTSVSLQTLLGEITHGLHLPQAPVISALCHLLWHGKLETDLCHHLIFQDAVPSASLPIWLRSPRGKV